MTVLTRSTSNSAMPVVRPRQRGPPGTPKTTFDDVTTTTAVKGKGKAVASTTSVEDLSSDTVLAVDSDEDDNLPPLSGIS